MITFIQVYLKMAEKEFYCTLLSLFRLAMLINFLFLASHKYPFAEARHIRILSSGDGVTETDLLQVAQKLQMFVDEIPMIPTIKGYTTSSEGAYMPANLSIGMYMKLWKFHRDLPESPVFAFGESVDVATVPGPTIEAISGVKTYVEWKNYLPDQHIFTIDRTLDVARPTTGVPTVVHLHGGVTEPASDGHALAWYTKKYREKGENWEKAVYVYHNPVETSTIWYHDHAVGYTRLNLLAGLIGAYKIINPDLENKFSLPKREFDQQLVIMDRSFTKDGRIYINSTGNNPDIHPEWQPEYFGNVIVVNGKAWPYMRVKRRKYRFRIINASNARYFGLSMDDGTNFTQIASDSSYLAAPISIKSILLGASETADVIIDFSMSKSNSIILNNDARYPFPNGDAPGITHSKVMKFMIEEKEADDDTHIPTYFKQIEKLREEEAVVTRNIVMYEYDSTSNLPMRLVLNFANLSDPVSDFPKHGSIELWHVVNLTPDNHPFHIHLVSFQVLRQQKLKNLDNISACALEHKGIEQCNIKSYFDEDPTPPPPNEAGWKNAFKMQPSYVTSILVKFSMTGSKYFPFDPTGKPGYFYHCHILDHEDNVMIRPYILVN
ncbi:hypothetical protein KP509_15G029200 [Ceratopteris richardii]|uniref:Uncharacterized protein n=1 Tax=Ceratopteris richardii TaxID=49495 RepID=A0A8T2T224_CERRI|nr:hypothetical protein KP509_15G029200 [Ceratopteris richardii]